MTPSELTTRVMHDTCALVALAAAVAAWLGGAPAAVGIVAGGALAVGSFRWLVARAGLATATGGVSSGAWLIGAGLRFAACAAACALLLATGWAHPIALLAGYTVLPCDLVTRALAAREER